MKHLEELLKIQQNCHSTIERLVSDKERLTNILNTEKSKSDNSEVENSVNEINSKIERMINLASEGRLEDLNKLRDEITEKYGRSNK